MSTEFDQVFEQLEAPDYPATCDNCGMEGTNASMKDHTCNEPPAPRAGERDEWAVITSQVAGYVWSGKELIATCSDPEHAEMIYGRPQPARHPRRAAGSPSPYIVDDRL